MYKKLWMFAYGTYGEYQTEFAAGKAAALKGAEQAKKLRQLTLATLATRSKVIGYDTMLAAVGVGGVRELEDLVISCFYEGVIGGKLDQRRRLLEVDTVVGRDVHPSQVARMAAILAAWEERSEQLLKAAEQQAAAATAASEAAVRQREEFEAHVKLVKENAKAMLEEDQVGMSDMMGMEMLGGPMGMMMMMGMGMDPRERMMAAAMMDDRKKRRVRSKRDGYQGKGDRS